MCQPAFVHDRRLRPLESPPTLGAAPRMNKVHTVRLAGNDTEQGDFSLYNQCFTFELSGLRATYHTSRQDELWIALTLESSEGYARAAPEQA